MEHSHAGFARKTSQVKPNFPNTTKGNGIRCGQDHGEGDWLRINMGFFKVFNLDGISLRVRFMFLDNDFDPIMEGAGLTIFLSRWLRGIDRYAFFLILSLYSDGNLKDRAAECLFLQLGLHRLSLR